MKDPIVFSGSPLDRSSNQRRDPAWLDALLARDDSCFLPLWKLQPLVKLGESRSLGWARASLLEAVEPRPEPMLLGLEGGVAHFAVDISSLDDPIGTLGVEGAAKFEDLRAVAGALSIHEAAIAGHGKALVDWHVRHQCCPVCAGDTRPRQGGGNRVCLDCSAEHFPRTDPVAIAVIVREGRCLLGRAAGFPGNMYSALAGFIEQGETLEEAVRREVKEESDIDVGDVSYVLSQPWPFPSSLMIGCLGEGLTEKIEIDRVELQDARWFGREEVRSALAGENPDFFVPPAFAVAHHLIRAFVEQGD